MAVEADDGGVRKPFRHRNSRILLSLAILGVAVSAAIFMRRSDHGDADPGGTLLAALRPVAAAVPAGVADAQRQFVEPRWDSCDGVATTYGWDDVTVDVSFSSNAMTDAAIVAHIEHALSSDGWTFNVSSSGTGAWYWDRQVSSGHHAVIQLIGGATVDPSDQWDLQATTPPATHPVTAC